jgi:glycosyltransferase involved in cell wall biosynthesis
VDTVYIYISPYDILRPRTNQVSDVRFCDGFIQNNRKIHLIVPYVDRPDNISKAKVFENYGISDQLEIHYLNTNFKSDVKGKFNFLKIALLNFFQIRKIIKSQKNNYILISRSVFILLPLMILKPLLGKNIKLTYWAHDFKKKKIFEQTYLRCDRIIATNSSIIKSIHQLTKYPLNKTIISSNPITQQQVDDFIDKTTARTHIGRSMSENLIVYTGKLAKEYNQELEYILNAAKRLPDTQFVFTGGKPLAVEYWKERCNELQITNTTFTGYSHNYQEIKYYQFAADVLISYYTKQGHDVNYNFPNKICEYMLTGNPIITPDYPATQDLLNEHNCYFVMPENEDELAKKIKMAIEDLEKSTNIAKQARLDVKQNTFKIRVSSIINFLESNE